jgi:glycosyltransferase involved in cell wall biosynthesis
MKISIVTISFNQQQYLPACIESILSQADCELEYIVVDPGSTDESRQIIESYGDRLVKVFERDAGPADGLNRGFARATGDIFGFINSDDYLLPGALKTVTQFFTKHGNNVFVTGQGYTENEYGARTPIHPNRLTTSNMLHRSGVVFQQSTFFPAELYKKAGGFNDQNRTCWDYELFLRFLMQGATHQVIEQELAVFRLYQGSISGSGRLEERYYKELDQLFEQSLGRKRNALDKLLTQYQRIQRILGRRLFG